MAQHHKIATGVGVCAETVGISVIQASRRRLNETIETAARLNCVHNTVNVGITCQNGTIRSVVRRTTENLIVKSDCLFRCNMFGIAIGQYQIDIRTINCFDNLARHHHIAFLQHANLALGIGSSDLTLYIGSFCGGLCHNDLLIKSI